MVKSKSKLTLASFNTFEFANGSSYTNLISNVFPQAAANLRNVATEGDCQTACNTFQIRGGNSVQ